MPQETVLYIRLGQSRRWIDGSEAPTGQAVLVSENKTAMSDWANFGGGGAADNNKLASGKVGVRKEGRGLGNGC